MERRLPDLPGLGVRQPWAELILRGIKTIEVRGLRFRRPDPIYLYATREFSDLPGALEAADKHGLIIEALPRGLIVGIVEIAECRSAVAEDAEAACVPTEHLKGRFSWVLRNVRRIDPPCSPWNSPYGMWFRPFGKRRAKPHRGTECRSSDHGGGAIR